MAAVTFNLSRFSPIIPAHLKQFDPSYVTRYAIVSELVREAGKQQKKPLKILDVGGYNGALGNFLPESDITILDVVEDKKTKNYVQASGAEMPFKDGEFDVVLSCDTLEHIPESERDKFIGELLRVTNNYCFLGAPFGSPAVKAAELAADMFYHSMTGENYTWLKEHAEYVLPDKKWLTDTLKKQSVYFGTFCHTSIDLWTLTLCSSFFLAGNVGAVDKTLGNMLREGGNMYIKEFMFDDFPPEGYRTFFVVSKKNEVKISLPPYNRARAEAFLNKELVLLGGAMRELTRNFGHNLEVIRTQADEKRQLTEELSAVRQELNNMLDSRAYKLAKRLAKAKKGLRRA